MKRFLNLFWDGNRTVDGDMDMLKAFGFDSLECCSDPLDTRLYPQKLQMLELCGLGEVK